MGTAEVVQEQVTQHDESRALVLRALLDALASDDALIQCCAIKALRKLEARDSESRQQLVELLRYPDADVRADAADVLGGLGVDEATASLVEIVENDPEGDVRVAAVKALGAIQPPAALEPLVRCVREDGYPELELQVDDLEYNACWEVQSAALNALGELGDARATQSLIEILEDDSYEDLQESGFVALARLNDHGARKFLLDQLRNGRRLARRRSAWALVHLPEPGGESEGFAKDLLDALSDALRDEDTSVRVYSARALGECDDPVAVTLLAALLNDTDVEVRQEAATVLGRVRGPDVVNKLLTLLVQADLDLGRRIVQVLGEIGDPAASDLISGLLDTEDQQLLYDVVHALGQLAVPGGESTLTRILANQANPADIRVQAAWALSRILASTTSPGPAIDEAAQAPGSIAEHRATRGEIEQTLAAAALDADTRVCHAALIALVDSDPKLALGILVDLVRGNLDHVDSQPDPGDAPVQSAESDTMSPGLRDLVADRSPEDSTLAAILARSADLRAPSEPSRKSVQSKQHDSLRILAARLLGGLQAPPVPVMQALCEAASQGTAGIRREALLALGRLGDVTALPVLLNGLSAADRDIRLSAMDAIVVLDDAPGAEMRLAELLEDPEPLVRRHAVQAISAVGGEVANDRIPTMLDDTNREVCRAALQAVTDAMKSDALIDRVVDLMFTFSAELTDDAASVLRRLHDHTGASRLLDALSDTKRHEFHWICINALGDIYAAYPGDADRTAS